MNNLSSQYRQLQKASDINLILMDAEALNIFLPCAHASGPKAEKLAQLCRNLIHYYCFALDHETIPQKQSYLERLQQYRETKNFQSVLQSATRLNISMCFQLAKQLPVPPKSLPEKYHYIYWLIGEILKLRSLPDDQTYAQLFELAMQWFSAQQTISRQPIPVATVMEYAIKYCFMHQRRHENIRAKSICWGEEYNSYLQKYLNLGYRPKTAKTMAKQDFIKAHPLPKNADEQLETGEFPGHSNPAIRRYHQAYLMNSKQ